MILVDRQAKAVVPAEVAEVVAASPNQMESIITVVR